VRQNEKPKKSKGCYKRKKKCYILPQNKKYPTMKRENGGTKRSNQKETCMEKHTSLQRPARPNHARHESHSHLCHVRRGSRASINSTMASVSPSWCYLDQVDLKVMVDSPSEAPVGVHVIASPPGPDPELVPRLGLGPEPVLAA